MGSKASKPPEPAPLLEKPWRNINWGGKQDLLNLIRNFKPTKDMKHLRILLYGPVGAGKSSFINSVSTVVRGQSAILASVCATLDDSKSFTVQHKTHKIRKERSDEFPFVFCDIMGLGPGIEISVCVEDVILVMKGHVRDGYEFHSDSPLTEENTQFYNPHPTLEDKVHLLVCVFSANSSELNESVVAKIKTIRAAARDLDIPHVALFTHIDQYSDEINQNLQNVFKLTYLKKKAEEFSVNVGFDMSHIFPVRNYSDGPLEGNDDMDTLILSTLKHMLDYADDYIHEKMQTV